MGTATHDDVVRVFPGIEDHSVVEIQAMEATAEDLEAALLLLQGNEDDLIDTQQQKGSRLNLLLEILANSAAGRSR